MKNKIENAVKATGAMATALVVMFTFAVNLSPDLAMAMSDVPVLGTVVRVVTLNRYEKTIGGSEAEIVTPKIEGLKNEELMDAINKEFDDNASKLIEKFEKDAYDLQKAHGEEAHMGVGSDYEIRTNNDDYYVVDIYFYNVVGSSFVTHKFYTVDKKTGELVTLEELFKADADYIGAISSIVKNEMLERNEEGGAYWAEDDEYGEGFDKIRADQNFFVNEDGNIVICFDKYEIAAGVEGCPEFVIEKELIKEILK